MRSTIGGTGNRAIAVVALWLAAASLAGCATLPRSGPTSHEIERAAVKDNEIGFRIVDIDAKVATELAAAAPAPSTLTNLASAGRVDTLGPGDVLNISIYEVGVALFGGLNPSAAGTSSSGFDSAAHVNVLQNVAVNNRGDISLPYVGRLHVAGQTTADTEKMIERAMMGLSQRPQASVTIKTNLYNVIYISGNVKLPGRMELGLPRENLLDAVARAGGTTSQPDDMVIRLTRNHRSADARLSDIQADSVDNVELLPGDRIDLLNRPRTFLVLGSVNKVSQVPFEASGLSLAEAIARIGGPSDQTADAAAVYLFRNTARDDAAGGGPIIYRLNMMQAKSYFLSQEVPMRDKDVIYVASAASNAPAKLAQIVGQIFSPFLAVRTVAR